MAAWDAGPLLDGTSRGFAKFNREAIHYDGFGHTASENNELFALS